MLDGLRPKYNHWAVQFRKDKYTVGIASYPEDMSKFAGQLKDYRNLTEKDMKIIDPLISKLNLSYPVKITGV